MRLRTLPLRIFTSDDSVVPEGLVARKVSHNWLDTLWEDDNTNNRNNGPSHKRITAANKQKNIKFTRAPTFLFPELFTSSLYIGVEPRRETNWNRDSWWGWLYAHGQNAPNFQKKFYKPARDKRPCTVFYLNLRNITRHFPNLRYDTKKNDLDVSSSLETIKGSRSYVWLSSKKQWALFCSKTFMFPARKQKVDIKR